MLNNISSSARDFCHNIKQSSKNRLKFLINSVLVASPYFSSILWYNCFSRKPITRVAYVGASFVPIAVPCIILSIKFKCVFFEYNRNSFQYEFFREGSL